MHVSCIHVWAWWGREGETFKKVMFFKSIFEGVKGATSNLKFAATERAGPVWCHFRSALELLWLYSNDSVSLYDHFGIIVESFWVYEGRTSKNIYFPNRF